MIASHTIAFTTIPVQDTTESSSPRIMFTPQYAYGSGAPIVVQSPGQPTQQPPHRHLGAYETGENTIANVTTNAVMIDTTRRTRTICITE